MKRPKQPRQVGRALRARRGPAPDHEPAHRPPSPRRRNKPRPRLPSGAPLGSQAETEHALAHYAELYDLAPIGYVTLDRTGLVRSLNLSAAELLGRGRQDLLGRPFQVLVSARSRRRFLHHLSLLRRGAHHTTCELEISRAHGPIVAIQMVVAARGTRRHPALEFQAALVDISERKREQGRTAALARLGVLLSSARDAAATGQALADTARELCGWDACFVALYDPRTETLTDLANLEMVKGRPVPAPPMAQGRPVSPLIRRVLQEGPQLVLRDIAEDKRSTAHPPGETSSALPSLMCVPIRLNDTAIGVLSLQSHYHKAYSAPDVAILQSLADHTAGALARLQAQGELGRLNDQLEQRITERTAQLQQYRDHLEEQVKQRTAELEATNAQLRLEVNSRKLAEDALVGTAEELKRSNLELEQFAYVVSHDLQEPLRAVGGYVRLLEHGFRDKLEEKARNYIEAAAEGANRMEQQLTDLLALSRVGVRGLKLAAVDLSEPLKAALQNLQFTILNAQANVTADPLPCVRVDASQMAQLFQNLIANAIKFRRDGPPAVHVSAREEDGRWVIAVRDNGIGIEPQYFERIFQVFQRLHTRKTYPGTGIGLAICRKIVERHGGKMWVESQPGQGSTFYFSLPK